MSDQMPPPNYCAAPWTTGVFRIDGVLLPCERNHTPYGRWQNGAAARAWNGEVAQYFRREISNGRYPNEMCERCYKNNNQARFERVIASAFRAHSIILQETSGIDLKGTERLESILVKIPRIEPEEETYIIESLASLMKQLGRPAGLNRSTKLSLQKLIYICEAALAYRRGSPIIDYAPLARIVNLIAICNARCIQCPFLFTREIIEGYRADNGTLIRELDADFLADVFADTDSMTDFFMYGSEFLLYRHWREVASAINSGGVRLSISSNGMTLNHKNMDYLVDNEVFSYLNVSFDGSTPETIQAVRQNVRYETLCKNVSYMFSRLETAPRFFHNISFSFCLMTDNFKDLAGFIPLLVQLRGQSTINFSLQIHALAPLDFAGPDYKSFVEAHHHSRIDRSELIEALGEVKRASEQSGIHVGLFYRWGLQDFVAADFPFPGLV